MSTRSEGGEGFTCGPNCWRSVDCTLCGMRKQPIGRSMPMETAGSYCDEECPAYRKDPYPPHLFSEHDSTRHYSDPKGWAAHEASCADCRGES